MLPAWFVPMAAAVSPNGFQRPLCRRLPGRPRSCLSSYPARFPLLAWISALLLTPSEAPGSAVRRKMASESGPAAPPAAQRPEQHGQEVRRHERAAAACRGEAGYVAGAQLPLTARLPPLTAALARLPASQPPGAEFFRRRMQRAAAIPLEQRDPAVHAFVTSVQLMSAADELLPLTADGQPALPAGTLAGQWPEVQAMLLVATAAHVVPDSVEWEGSAQDRFSKYMNRRLGVAASSSWDAAYQPALQPLGGLLHRHMCSLDSTDLDAALTLCKYILAEVEASRTTISRQLQRLQHSSGAPLLSVTQLEAAVLSKFVAHGLSLFHTGAQRLADPQAAQSAGSPAEICAAMLAAADRLAKLEPSSPKALLCAASAALATEYTSAPADLKHHQRSMDLYLQALHAAQAQRSAYWETAVSCRALPFAAQPRLAISSAHLAAYVAAAEQAPAVAHRLSRVLPHAWVAVLNASATAAAAMLPVARLRLQGGGNAAEQVQAVLAAVDYAGTHLSSPSTIYACSSCGQRAVGLRRCARCRQAACEWNLWVGRRGCDAVEGPADSLQGWGVVVWPKCELRLLRHPPMVFIPACRLLPRVPGTDGQVVFSIPPLATVHPAHLPFHPVAFMYFHSVT